MSTWLLLWCGVSGDRRCRPSSEMCAAMMRERRTTAHFDARRAMLCEVRLEDHAGAESLINAVPPSSTSTPKTNRSLHVPLE